MPGMTRQECVRLNIAQIRDHAVGTILERHDYIMAVCVECFRRAFVHEEGCTIAAEVEESWAKPVGELGPMFYLDSED